MRVAHIITSLLYGGAEKLLVDTLPLYKSLGLDVDLILFNGVSSAFKTSLENSGVRIISLSKKSGPYNPLYILKLVKLLEKYDVVHTHNYAPQIFAALVSLFTRTCLVTTEHSTTNRRRKYMFCKPLDRWMYKRYKKIICISQATKEALVNYLPDVSNLLVINNGINVQRYEMAKPALSIKNKNVKLVTMVGGFRKEKDQDTLIKAVGRLPEFNIKVLLVGDGERREELLNLVNMMGLSNVVEFMGVRSDIPEILKSSDVVVQSSHYEGFGLAAVEGMAAGKPVVASDVPGLSDIVRGSGLLFTSGDDLHLSQLLSKLLSDAEYYSDVAKKCSIRAKEYDVCMMVRKYFDVYMELTKEKS